MNWNNSDTHKLHVTCQRKHLFFVSNKNDFHITKDILFEKKYTQNLRYIFEVCFCCDPKLQMIFFSNFILIQVRKIFNFQPFRKIYTISNCFIKAWSITTLTTNLVSIRIKMGQYWPDIATVIADFNVLDCLYKYL